MERRDLLKLPPDLTGMGWQWVSTESVAIHRGSAIWYKAVYAWPFERRIDADRLANHHKGCKCRPRKTWAHGPLKPQAIVSP